MTVVPRVTVVTAAHDASPWISATIESVLSQSFTDFEYIIVDDGSTDDTAAIAVSYAPRVTVIRQGNEGVASARNRGFERARSEFVAIIDADDTWAADKLALQVQAMDRCPKAGLCYTNATRVSVGGAILASPMVAPHPPLTCLSAMTGSYPLVNSAVLLRRRYLEPRPYRDDLRLAEDFHVNLKALWRSGEHAVFIDKPLVTYLHRDSSVLRAADPHEHGGMALRAVEALIEDMSHERPLPPDVARRAVAFARYQWAWFCIDAGVDTFFAARLLLRALVSDCRLGPRVARQFVKIPVRRVAAR